MKPENTNEQNYPRLSLGIALIREKFAKKYPELATLEVIIAEEKVTGVVSWSVPSGEQVSISAEFETWKFCEVLKSIGVLLFLYALNAHKENLNKYIINDIDDAIDEILSERCEYCGAQLKSSGAGFCLACGKPRTWDSDAGSDNCPGGN